MRRFAPLMALLAIAGCEDEAKKESAPTATAAATTASATAEPTATAAPATPSPLAVEKLKKDLGCGGSETGACEVLEAFTACVEWSPVTDSGDGRWLGRGYVVRDGKATEQLSLLRTRRVPLDSVGPGQIGAKVGLTEVPEDKDTVRREAERALKAYARGDVPQPRNAAVRYIEQREQWPEAFASKSENNQIHVADHGGLWLCGRDDQRLVAVRLAGSREHRADGTYAILYPVTW